MAQGIRGVTSNPTIFAKAIEGEDDYDEQFRSLVATRSRSRTPTGRWWSTDITTPSGSCARSTRSSGGTDGFVSFEVDPSLAHDTAGTVDIRPHLHDRIAGPTCW